MKKCAKFCSDDVGQLLATKKHGVYFSGIPKKIYADLGELAAGCAADLIVVDYIPPTPLGSDNFLGHLIFGMVDATVDTTIASGKVLMEGKKITALDEQAIAAKSRELAPQMWARRRAND